MNIKILHMIEGAKKATGTTVVIDVFRAFSFEAYCFYQGADRVIPIGNVEEAYKLKEQHPEYILAGERHGKILPGFDCGNSPSELVKLDVKGKTVVHTTSAGTQGTTNATGATEIIGGSLLCANAIARYIKQNEITDVSLVCMGLEAISPTEEDNLCAEYIKSILTGTKIDLDAEIENVKKTSGAKFFDAAQADVFPEADFHMCVEADKFDFIIRLSKEGYMEKIDVK